MHGSSPPVAEVACARIETLSLRDFRNFERLELTLPAPGIAIVGENGQGKTNLLEAMYYFSLLRSARGARDVDLVRFDAAGFFIDARLCAPDAHELSVGFERAGRRKKVRRDGVVADRLSDALGTLPAVMFSPTDVELVSGGPSARRRYLDIMLALTSRGYLHALQQYRGGLERRNAALRAAARQTRDMSASIEVWEGPLAEHGATLVRTRRSARRSRPSFAVSLVGPGASSSRPMRSRNRRCSSSTCTWPRTRRAHGSAAPSNSSCRPSAIR